MLVNFPSSYQDAYDWQWSDWKAYFEALVNVDLTEETIEQWLLDWTQLDKLFKEVSARHYVATTVDTSDEEAEAYYKNFMSEINPEAEKIIFRLNKKLVESGLAPEEIKVPLRNVEAEIRLFNEANLPLLSKIAELDTAYNKIAGAQTVEWDGKEVTLRQLLPVFKETDREKRQKAWVLSQERVYQDRPQYNDLWREYMTIRKQIFENAGFDNYREYAWLDRNRFDYSPEDVLRFVEAIEEIVVPLETNLIQKDCELLGIESMRPWDTAVDIHGREALKAYETIDEFIETSEAIFKRIDPNLGKQFQIMKNDGLLDLENRKGKRSGGYCHYFASAERPFIFMNAVGLDSDVKTILHESGHAFHGFARSKLKYSMQHNSPMEFNEVASMAMELLAIPYITQDEGGFFTEAEAARFVIDHLRRIITFWPYMAIVVAFQHWAYLNHDDASNPDNCDAKWVELYNRFRPSLDWSGYEQHKSNRWREQGHIFRYPFYYVEYGLAQLGAVQIWANALNDHAKALRQYQEALALRGTVTLAELYEIAGAKLAFDAETLGEAVALIERKIAEFEESE